MSSGLFHQALDVKAYMLNTGTMGEPAHKNAFEIEKENGKYDLQYDNVEGGIQDLRLAEADDDGRWPPRDGMSSVKTTLCQVFLIARNRKAALCPCFLAPVQRNSNTMKMKDFHQSTSHCLSGENLSACTNTFESAGL